MNLYQLLNEIESGKIAVEHFEYKEIGAQDETGNCRNRRRG